MIVLILTFLLASSAQAGTPVGTAILVKGRVGVHNGTHNVYLKEGDKVEEGARITTGPGSAAKILLLDRTELKLGADSSLAVQSLRSSEAGVVTLAKGNVRTQVVKDPLAKAGGSPPAKFFIRTKTATMGVRGTELDTIYNPINNVTSVVTYEGSVAMISASPGSGGAPSSLELQNQFASANPVVITPGNFSTVTSQSAPPTSPTKISPAQFASLKAADPLQTTKAAGDGGAQKSFFSPIPPGVDAQAFAAGPASGESKPPETADGAPRAGGFVDLKTGLYVAPPPGSSYDANTGVFVPPPSLGTFNPADGQFTPPAGTVLSPNGTFVPVGSPGANGPPPSIFPPGTAPPPPPSPGQLPPGGVPPLPVIGGDTTCGAGCLPQGPPPGQLPPPPPPPGGASTVNFVINAS